MKTRVAVISVVKFEGRILLLKRSSDRESSPGKWQPVSGFIKEGEAAEKTALRELKEETGLEGEIVEKGETFEVRDKWGRWIVVPFLISVGSDELEIDREEHSEYKWIKPRKVIEFDCVEGVEKDLKSVGLL